MIYHFEQIATAGDDTLYALDEYGRLWWLYWISGEPIWRRIEHPKGDEPIVKAKEASK